MELKEVYKIIKESKEKILTRKTKIIMLIIFLKEFQKVRMKLSVRLILKIKMSMIKIFKCLKSY
jgi:hypothetical protein